MKDDFDFLLLKDERKIKFEYEKEKKLGKIDADIVLIIDKLNSINGLATLYSCQGHLNTPKSYIVIKFNKKLKSIIINAINELIQENENVRVDWNHTINYKIKNKETLHNATVIRGLLNCDYMYSFYDKLQNHLKEK